MGRLKVVQLVIFVYQSRSWLTADGSYLEMTDQYFMSHTDYCPRQQTSVLLL